MLPSASLPRWLGLDDGRGPLLSRNYAALSADPKLHAFLLNECEQPLPHVVPWPADECLGCHPPQPKLVRHCALLGAIVVPPQDRADRAPQMPKRHFGMRANCLNQKFQHPLAPWSLTHCASVSIRPPCQSSIKQNQPKSSDTNKP